MMKILNIIFVIFLFSSCYLQLIRDDVALEVDYNPYYDSYFWHPYWNSTMISVHYGYDYWSPSIHRHYWIPKVYPKRNLFTSHRHRNRNLVVERTIVQKPEVRRERGYKTEKKKIQKSNARRKIQKPDVRHKVEKQSKKKPKERTKSSGRVRRREK
jgi:hypothetical protein